MPQIARAPLETSYTRGPHDIPLLDLCIGQVLDRAAKSFPHNDSLVVRHQNRRYSYSSLREEVDRTARALMSLGVAKGDRVGIWSTNCAEWVLTQFATAKVGAILVSINPLNRSRELAYALKQSECQTVIIAAGFRDIGYAATLLEVSPTIASCEAGAITSPELPDLRTVIYLGADPPRWAIPWETFVKRSSRIQESELRRREASLDCRDAINIQYTSGTTGFPKGATLSHHNIVNNGYLIAHAMGFSERDRLCIPVPFYHCFGMVLANIACVVTGATMVLPAAHFDPVATLEAVEAERCTALHGVPTMFIAELNHPEFKRFDLRTLRTGIMAGSPCPIEVMRRVVDDMHCREMTIAYGLTEASPVITQTTTDDPLELRVATVGRAMPHTEAKVIDPQTGVTLPVGVPGELCTRGYLVMKGYYKNPEATRAAIDSDGWLHTGDIAVVDAKGYFRITGRAKDIIIRGGENISPREVEEFLYTCPGVVEAQVIGIPSEKYGEEVMAWVRLEPGSSLTLAQLAAFCRGKIADFKIPRYLKVVESFPMTVTGKVQKYLMREASAKELKRDRGDSIGARSATSD